MNHLNIFLDYCSVFLDELIALGDLLTLTIFKEYIGLQEVDITLFLSSLSFLDFLPLSYLIRFFSFWIIFLILIFSHLSSSLIFYHLNLFFIF